MQHFIKCNKCDIRCNQPPLLDISSKCEIMWVGLSAKIVDSEQRTIPLSQDTKSGSLIYQIEKDYNSTLFYKTNLVKCAPVQDGKLRYPSTNEISNCISNLLEELHYFKPKLVFLLGEKVIKSCFKELKLTFSGFDDFRYESHFSDEIEFVPVHHPSYITIYQSKNKYKYIEAIQNKIELVL